MPFDEGEGFNFHFGLNLMASGHDYITLEDYANSGAPYYFDMYGPESEGQAWSQALSNIEPLAAKTTAMVVQHPESLVGSVNTDNAHFEQNPDTPTGDRFLAQGVRVNIIRKGHSWMKVKVWMALMPGNQAG